MCVHAEFSGAGKGEYEVCASNERNMDVRGRESRKCVLKRVKKKRMRVHPFCCIGSIIFRVDGNFPTTLF